MNRYQNITLMKILASSLFLLCLGSFSLSAMSLFIDQAGATEYQSRTESNCTIGIVKGDTTAECHVPILNGCTVAQFPGYDEPWAEVSKGGATSCEFDPQKTDWKSSIVGTCQACKTDQCTGRFTVMLNCADNIPAANPAFPQ